MVFIFIDIVSTLFYGDWEGIAQAAVGPVEVTSRCQDGASVVGHQVDEVADLGQVAVGEVAEGATADQAAFGEGTDVFRAYPGGLVRAGSLPVDRDVVREAAVDGGAGRTPDAPSCCWR